MDPDFTKAFPIDYLFEEVQKVNVAVYDIDNNTPKLNDDDFLGQIECTLGQVCIFFCICNIRSNRLHIAGPIIYWKVYIETT